MAKNNKNKPIHNFHDLSRKDINNRKIGINKDIQELKQDRKNADTPQERQAITDKIHAKQDRLKQANAVLEKRDTTKVYDNTTGKRGGSGKTVEELQNDIYSSDDFLRLSKENQDLIRATVDSFSPERLRDMKITKQEMKLIYKDAKISTAKKFKSDLKKFDQTYEQALRQDTADLQRVLDDQIQQMEADNAADAADETLTAAQRQANADQRIISIRDLQDALDIAKEQYAVEADRANTYLQNTLSDIQSQLDTSLGRADEDKVLALRQLERRYSTQLRDVQDSMAQRGLAFSGIRARAEDELASQYEDNMTTAQLDAQRKQEDAQRLAEQQSRDVNLMTSQNIEDLVTKYTGISRSAVKSAESVLGSTDTAPVISAKDYSINGTNPTSYLYGGLTGSLANSNAVLDANAAAQETQRKAKAAATDTQRAELYAAYERQYGTKALQENFGSTDGLVGANGVYSGYTPVGNIGGTDTRSYIEGRKQIKQIRRDTMEQIRQADKTKALLGKFSF